MKKILTILLCTSLIVTCIPVSAIYAEEVKNTTYKTVTWTQEAKKEYTRLLSNLHKNVNKERPEFNLPEEVKWSSELEYVSKVKLKHQWKSTLL